MVVFINHFNRCRYADYLNGVQRRMPNSQSSFDISGSGTSGNEWTSQSYMKYVAYNCTLSYSTCYSFGSVYSFCINVYDRSYLSGSTNQSYNKLPRLLNLQQVQNLQYHIFTCYFAHVLYGKLLPALAKRR